MVCTIWRLASCTQHMPLRFIRVVPHINSLFLLLLNSIPLYGCNSLSFATFVNFSGTIASKFFFPVLYSFYPSWCHRCYTFWYLFPRLLRLLPSENIVIHPSVSFIQETIFEHLLFILLLLVMQLFPIFFYNNNNVAVWTFSLGTCTRLSPWHLPMNRIARM